jgi:hypothetical protein
VQKVSHDKTERVRQFKDRFLVVLFQGFHSVTLFLFVNIPDVSVSDAFDSHGDLLDDFWRS